MSRIELHRNALIYEGDDGWICLGRWDRLFGCWQGETPRQVARMTFMDPWDLALGSDGEAAVDAYRRLIPADARDLAESFDDLEWPILDAIWHVPGFAAFAARELETIGPGYITLAHRVAQTFGWAAWVPLPVFREMMTCKRHTLFENIVPDVDGRLFNRIASHSRWCDWGGFDREIDGLIDCVRSPVKARLLLSLDLPGGRKEEGWATDWDVVWAMALLPDDAVGPGIVALTRKSWTILAIDDVIRTAERCSPELRQRAAQSARALRDPDQVSDWADRWMQVLAPHVPMPKPPFAGTPRLVPLDSYDKLRAEGEEMAHCVRVYGHHVLAGTTYVYRWLGPPRATIALCRNGRGGPWRIGQAKGRGNAELPVEVLEEIQRELASQGLRTTPSGP